ncbi:MAG: ABC transporter permease [bacterium]|nr:ABC transporter permease [bacterium]
MWWRRLSRLRKDGKRAQLHIQPATGGPARRLAEASVVPLIAMVVWYALTRSIIDPAKLPGPDRVLGSLVEIIDLIPSATWVSLQMVLLGLVLGSITGLATGIIFGYSPFVRRFFEATLDNLVRPVPLFALIPLFILWFGIGFLPQVGLVALGMFLMFTLVTLEAIRNVPHIFVQAALTTGASRFLVYRTVVIPAIIPHLVGFLRLAVASAWGLDVAAEFLGSREGLGYILLVRNQYLDPAGMLMIVALFCIMAIIFDQTVRFISAKVTRWSPRTDRGLVGSMLGN